MLTSSFLALLNDPDLLNLSQDTKSILGGNKVKLLTYVINYFMTIIFIRDGLWIKHIQYILNKGGLSYIHKEKG
jgi:hypothetical protein